MKHDVEDGLLGYLAAVDIGSTRGAEGTSHILHIAHGVDLVGALRGAVADETVTIIIDVEGTDVGDTIATERNGDVTKIFLYATGIGDACRKMVSCVSVVRGGGRENQVTGDDTVAGHHVATDGHGDGVGGGAGNRLEVWVVGLVVAHAEITGYGLAGVFCE